MAKDRFISRALMARTFMVVSSLLPLSAFAFTPPGLTTVLPQRQTPTLPAPDNGLQPMPPELAPPSAPGQPVEEAAKAITFKLNKIIFEGMTIFKPEDLLPLYQDKLGKKISLADLQLLAQAFEKYYTERGYILTRVIIPPQEIGDDGVVHIQVIEGYISDVVIQGDTKLVQELIKDYTRPVLASRPLQISVLERAVLLINDVPGVATKAVLTPSEDVPGASTLVLVVSQHILDSIFAWDNRGTRYLGPEEFTLNSDFNNVFRTIGQFGADIKMTAATRELQSYQGTYQIPIFGDGSTLQASYVYNHVMPGSTLSPLLMTGLSESATLLYTYPVFRTRRTNLSISLDYDFLYSNTFILHELFNRDKIESIRFGFSFNGADNVGGTTLATGQISQGIQLLTGDNPGHLIRSREFGTKDYTKATASLTRLQALPWQFSLFMSAAGQLAFNDLLSAEQIGYGGVQYGSAYDPSEIISDSGAEGKVELRYNSADVNTMFRSVQYYSSYDFGVLWAKNPLFVGPRQSGQSAAIGLRLSIGPRVTTSFELAKPLTLKPAAYDNRDFRGFFSVTADLGNH